ncbi:MAG: hypothetical protein IIA23_08255 [Chloroflexi bacterium]|nr:hypothetical protein [Chloroflexota bacterium]
MSIRKSSLLIALAALALVLSACGDGGGGVLLASPIPRPEGRTVTSDDGKLTLEIPPGALDEDVAITITAVPLEELPEELQVVRGAGDGYQLEPDGLEFSRPVAVTLELGRDELEDEPADGITGYALVSFTAGGERELLDKLRTEASLGEDTVVVRGELSHFSWLGRTKSSLTVLLEEVQREQPVAGQFQAKATWANTDASGTVTLGSGVAEYLASGSVQVAGDVFAVQDDITPGQEVEGGTLYQCSESQQGPGAYGVLVTLRSTVEVGDETIVTRLRVVLTGAVECG